MAVEAKYTSPSGKECSFIYEKLTKKSSLKTGIYTFPDKDGALVQSLGVGVRSFPLECIFNGDTHYEDAKSFVAALEEKGIGELQHPLYGIHKVVPTGDIEEKDDLISETNQSVINVTFVETITDTTIVSTTPATIEKLDSAVDDYMDGASTTLASGLKITKTQEALNISATMTAQIKAQKKGLEAIAKKSPSVISTFLSNYNSACSYAKKISTGIDSAMDNALNAARFVLNMALLPSKIATNITEKIKGYSTLIKDLISQYKNVPAAYDDIANQYQESKMALESLLAFVSAGAAETITDTKESDGSETGIRSRDDVINIVNQIIELNNSVKEYEDKFIATNAFVDSDDSFQKTQKVVSTSIQLIMDAVYQLPMRHTYTLERDRQFIELCAELYGNVENKTLENFIAENNLTADEMVIIPMGREVVYYE